ncbi:NAD-dependent epimerase/dehydratase family protein [Aeromonas veronii]|uniref:NAD-dependent epimerase/dehydratase family protein n=1 Tax=Aeromonas veronii TaxID=654 RepID=UPI00192025BD|nr:NAD-dependent epimerase/dehydratase [Aeromonas veronii]MBL0464138.1 NAD-dependent epimerase/dehydratase [Aeromonas veronii]
MRIIITGISGYLGSQIANTLISKHEIAGTIRKTSALTRLNDKTQIELITVDEDDWEDKIKSFKPDIVINTAALYGRKGESVSALIEANFLFPIKLIENLDENTVFINCGTSLPSSVSLYAQTKNQFVDLAKTYCETKKIQLINLRLEHFFGPGDDERKFTSYVINQCLKNLPLNLTEGSQVRDFIYIDDLISAFECIVKSLDKLAQFENIDVGSGNAITVREFVETVISKTHSNSKVNFGAVPMRENELMYSCANTELLMNLNWNNQFSMNDAISKMLDKEKK